MIASGQAAWLILCRENDNDPLADHIGGENASGTAAFLFYLDQSGFQSRVFSPIGEATALTDLAIHDVIIPVPRGESAIQHAAAFVLEQNFPRLAVNTSISNAQGDGLSHAQYQALVAALGENWTDRLVSPEQLVYEWLSIKLPAEVEIMRQAAEVAARWQIEAYQQIVPGVTTDADVAAYLKQRMAEAGVNDAWAPDQNPNVNSGSDRGHSHATDKIILPGDVIQTDFGIKVYDRWVSDIQRFAYVLSKDESTAPPQIQHYWESA